MKMRMTALAAGMALVLSACGGGDSAPKSVVKAVTPVETSPASTPVAASVPAAASDPVVASQPAATDPASVPVVASSPAVPAMTSTPAIRIVIFGDDQAEGVAMDQYGMPSMVTPNEATQLQSLLQKQFNDSGIVVQNVSSGGGSSSLQNELDGMDGLGAGQPQRMEQSGAQIVVEAHMLNDALGGETASEYGGYLTQQVQNAQTAGVTLVFEQDSPACDSDHPQLSTYADTMAAVAKQYKVPLIAQYSAISSLSGWQQHTVDCLVPDSTLDSVKAQQAQAVIAPLIQKILGE